MIKIRQDRQYVRVFHAADQAKSDQAAPQGPMADLYYEIEDDIHLDELREDIRRMRRKRAPKREIEKAQIRVTKFEQRLNELRARKRAKARGDR